MQYVNNGEFKKLLRLYNETGDKKAYNRIGKVFYLIAFNLKNKPCFINYTKDRHDEMISDATFMMCRYINRYDETKSKNPFAYFTRFAYNAFLQNINGYNKLGEKFISLSFIENFDKNGE
jgi:hypothetical protein